VRGAQDDHPDAHEAAVERALTALGSVRRRSPSPYASSWPLEEVELERPDGSTLRLLLKRLWPAPASRPSFLCDPAREIEAYRLLEPERLGAPRCYGSGGGWLLLEKVEGVELWQRGDLDAWQAVARWVAGLHERFAGRELRARRLLRHDRTLHRLLLARARERLGGRLGDLSAAGEVAIARLAALPRTVVHGELYASNVLIGRGDRVAAVDWEMAGAGPGVIDLAALVTGWEGDERRALVAAFGAVEEADLAAAELLLALQWLGWTPGWRAPPEHRRDWLAQARAAAERLR
jgi:hypothetical protein